MRSVGPAGWASHGFFGFKAQTFGNPDGASSGGGAWTGQLIPGGDSDALPAKARRDGGLNPNGPNQGGGGGGAGPTPLSFTSRGTVSSHAFYAIASDTSGNTLAIDSAGNVYRSDDGGHTWANVGTIAGFNPAQGSGSLVFGDGAWLVTAGENVYRSTDAGAVWTGPTNTNVDQAGGAVLATTGGGQWIDVGNDSVDSPFSLTVYANSFDNGVTWTQADNIGKVSGTDATNTIVYTGSDFVFGALDSSFAQGWIFVSPDGISWTNTESTNGGCPGSLVFSGGNFYATEQINGAQVMQSPTAPGLASAALIALPAVTGAFFGILLKTSANFFAVDVTTTGAVCNSSNFTQWVQGTLNLAAAESAQAGCYDSSHDSAIVAGSAGTIVTFP